MNNTFSVDIPTIPMADCDNLERCSFFQELAGVEKYKVPLAGFVRMYCKGSKQNLCVRKVVALSLGHPSRVPWNMLPNGLPLEGTSDSEWHEQVRKTVTNRNRLQQ